MKKHKILSTIFFCSLLAGVAGLAWTYIEGVLLGSSDPNIGAGGLMMTGFVIAVLSGLAWAILSMTSSTSQVKSKTKGS